MAIDRGRYANIHLGDSASSYEVVHKSRQVDVYTVSEQELRMLSDSTPTLWFTFFGLALGAAIAFGTVAFSQAPSAANHATWIALFWPSLVLTVFFLIMAVRSQVASSRRVKAIMEGATARTTTSTTSVRTL